MLNGARHLALGGNYAYIVTPKQLVVADLSEPLKPVVAATLPLNDLRASPCSSATCSQWTRAVSR